MILCLLWFRVSKDRLENVGAVCGGRNFGLPIDKAHRLYNGLLLPHKPWQKVACGISLWTTCNCLMMHFLIAIWTRSECKVFPEPRARTVLQRLFPLLLLSVRHRHTLQDHGYRASALRGVPVYAPAFTGTHCAYHGGMERPSWPGGWLHTEILFNLLMVTHPSTNQARRRVTSLIEINALLTKPNQLLLCLWNICYNCPSITNY